MLNRNFQALFKSDRISNMEAENKKSIVRVTDYIVNI